MQLSTIHNPDKAWHITTIKAYNQIKLNGGILTGGNTPNYETVGTGVYISIPENNQNIEDHLNLWTRMPRILSTITKTNKNNQSIP